MSITAESKQLLSAITTLLPNNIKPQTLPKDVITAFSRDMKKATIGVRTMSIKVVKRGVDEIEYPTTFNIASSAGIPTPIMREIRDTLKWETRVTMDMGDDKKVVLMFYGAATTVVKREMINRVAWWLKMIYNYKVDKADQSCVPPKLVCWFYLTSAKKVRGDDDGAVLSAIHANTAFTRTCVRGQVNEIVVYRAEEWFKVFIHETIHTFGLDFSGANEVDLERGADRMRAVFGGIKRSGCEVNLYEAYTEFWAEITNILFIAAEAKALSRPRTINAMVSMEAAFGQQQMHKVFDFGNEVAAKNYREKTSILAYYVIKNILLNNTAEFIDDRLPATSTSNYIGYIDFNAHSHASAPFPYHYPHNGGLKASAVKTQINGKGDIADLCNFIEAHKDKVADVDDVLVQTPTMRMTAWEMGCPH